MVPYTHSYKPHNGLVQGCPLSMILLTSLTTTWVEHCEVRTRTPQTCPRSYADDLAKSRNTTDLVAQTFISDAGMNINPNKCFTFGHKSVSSCVRKIPFHKNDFRLVRGSIKLTNKACWTELEQTRADKWKNTVGNVRSLPAKLAAESTYTSKLYESINIWPRHAPDPHRIANTHHIACHRHTNAVES